MVRTGLSVPGDFRKLVSPVVVIGLAVAPTADRRVKMAADAAIRKKLMALLLILSSRRPHSYLTAAAASPSRPSQSKFALTAVFLSIDREGERRRNPMAGSPMPRIFGRLPLHGGFAT
jgi:hypothetical protein